MRDVAGLRNTREGTPDKTRRDSVEFWNHTTKKWEVQLEPTRAHHSKPKKPLFHGASTTCMIEKFPNEYNALLRVDRATVDKSYRPWGLEGGNVYVTGAGLFPTAGSWNRASDLILTIQASMI